jgi:hypothetical protein
MGIPLKMIQRTPDSWSDRALATHKNHGRQFAEHLVGSLVY